MKLLLATTDIDFAEANMLARLAQRGVEVLLLCGHQARNLQVLESSGVEILRHEYAGHRDEPLRAQLRQLLAERQFDLLHVLRRIALSNVLAASRGLDVPIIAYRGVADRGSPFNITAWRGFLHPRVHRVLCVSHAIRDYFLSRPLARLCYPASRYVTIHKGHDPSWYQPTPREQLAEFGIPEGVPVIGFTGAMRPRKGVDLLIRAFDALPAEHQAHLLLIGEARDPKIAAAHQNAASRERIHFAGFRTDAAALAGACDLFAFPVLRPEGLPRSVIEAMAQGVPAVVSNMPGCTELVRDGINGRVVQSGDEPALVAALSDLLGDVDERARLAAAARDTIATDFHVDRTVDQYLAVYRDLCPAAMAALDSKQA